jgi:hypothetical protein
MTHKVEVPFTFDRLYEVDETMLDNIPAYVKNELIDGGFISGPKFSMTDLENLSKVDPVPPAPAQSGKNKKTEID